MAKEDPGARRGRLALLALGGRLECRTNWRVYAEEFSFALNLLQNAQTQVETFSAPQPLTPFERKYRDSGQTLYRVIWKGEGNEDGTL